MRAEPPSSSPSDSGKLPRWCLWALLLIALLVVYAGVELRQRLVLAPMDAAIQEHLQKIASSHAERVTNYMTDLETKVEKLANAPITTAAFDTPAENGIQPQGKAWEVDFPDSPRQWRNEAGERLPEASNLFLMPLNTRDFPLPGNFVARHQADRAAAGEAPRPRAARTEGWAIYLARPVGSDEEPRGVLLVEVGLSGLRDQFPPADGLQGRIELIQQTTNRRDASVFELGTSGEVAGEATADTGIPGWQLVFQADSRQLATARPGRILYPALMALIVALALTLAIWVLRRFRIRDRSGTGQSRHKESHEDLFTERISRSKPEAAPPSYSKQGTEAKATPQQPVKEYPLQVFRNYDIRGHAGSQIDEDFAHQLGRVLGSRVLEGDGFELAVCGDGRASTPALKEALCKGILSTGCDVLDLGQAPTPLLNFALATTDHIHSGVMVTASHNPAEDNGFKIILDNHVVSDRDILALRDRMLGNDLRSGEGERTSSDLHYHYIRAITEDVLAGNELHIVVDCGNGVAGEVAPELIREMGCRVTELYTEVDGRFPNHPPDPTVPANLETLIATVTSEGADLGLAFDGDGDRVVAVTNSGRIVWPDELLMIFARDVVTRNPGADIVFDVKSTRRLVELISNYGGRPVMWKTGHAHMRNKVRDSGAPLGGEFSGHIVFNDRWYGFDDGLYAAARLIEIIGLREQTLDEITASFPPACSTPEIRIPVDELHKHEIVEEIRTHFDAGDAHVVTLDGLRVEYDSGWGLIRASNTAAALTLRFEADSETALESIKTHFRDQLQMLMPELRIEF